MKKPKLLFFDLDNTLVNSKTHQIPDSAIAALQKLKSLGYRVSLATGRDYSMLSTTTKVLELIEWDGFVLSNGQVVLDRHHKEILHLTLPHTALIELIKTADTFGLPVLFSGEDNFLLSPRNNDVEKAHAFFNEPIPEVKEYTDQPIDKVLIYAPLDFDWKPFKDIAGVSVYPGVSTYADIIVKNISKYTGIKALLKHVGAESKPYAAFGDSLNDFDMIKHADLGIAMGNAEPELKKIADFVTSDVDDDGIAKALSYFRYI